MSMKYWPVAVPGDTELRNHSVLVSLCVILLAYGAYTLVLMLTAEPTFLVTFLILCAGLHSLGLAAYYLGRPLLASVWMTLVLLFCLTMMNIRGFTNEQSAQYYFILVPALIFMVLPPNRREWQITLLTLTLALLTLTFALPEVSDPWFVMSAEDYRRYKWVDLALCVLCMAVVSRFFIYRLLQQRNQLERLALTDTLTGLPNRHGIMRHLADWYNRGQRFSVLLLDVDDFREINRRSGHDVGDILMRKLAQRLRSDIDEPILIARVGGDQFLVANDQYTEPRAVLDLAARLQASASRMGFDLGGWSERISISIGATLSMSDEQPRELTNRLAQALRQARERTLRLHLLMPETDDPPDPPSVPYPSGLAAKY